MTNTSALTKKLQIKPHQRVLVLGAPEGFAASLAPLPEGVTLATTARGKFDVVHLFVEVAKDLEKNAPKAIGAVREGGVLWISYPKKSSKVDTDLTRDQGWKPIEEAGWGAVTQVAIDGTWSALRFKPEATVSRKANSAAAPGARKAAATKKSAPKREVEAPADLEEALAKNAGASLLWSVLSPSHRKEYIDWVEGAKKAETRARRVDQAIEMLTGGVKNRNEKYAQRSRGA